MEAITKPITEMTASEIEAFLKEKKAAETKQQETRKKEVECSKNEFLQEIAKRYLEQQKNQIELKKYGIENAEKYNSLKYELEGKTVKDAKSFELKNDSIKIVVETQDRFDFNDQAIVHITAIKDIFREKFENRNKGFYNLLDGILMKNTKGEYDAKLLTKARRQVRELGDDNLMSEFDKLNDCLIVVGSAKYIRVYTKDDKNRWKDISLNFSGL
jgi:hypothetical protein